ncbi:hypothetical protein GGTG_13528 [Gaeumannomyces tritici R3-111a-1]|uniref:HNH nuclease domain-containing protein n=1 Tax=Gaeumannomyces tritici (strain R3-111a-1) TaxID=644352 RepID=J3PJ45_GAET3|nr:hypothetical protein GGTG_13528 [Gaeumannomyces tritici R3-111a-1]EJT68940.1 hypothetical protein GGTG_13528 [Gaeumannomyces tritici R3-111a-1]
MDLRTNAYPAGPHHRHQSSLQGMLHAGTPVMEEDTRAQANIRMRHILQHCEAAANQQPQQGYNHPALVRLTHDYARSDDSKSLFLSSFFEHLDLPLAGNVTDSDVDFGDPEVKERLCKSVDAFAEYLMDNFFLPLKAVSNKTPQPSPITNSAVQRAQGSDLPQAVVGTPERVSTLRGTCLVRDRHRCVISRKFDTTEGRKRYEAAPGNARDDDGHLIGPRDFRTLEVAHILPHSLTKASDSLLSPGRKAALDVLNMFDVGVVYMIEGAEIDRPYNAITLSHEHHLDFGSFQIFFEPVPDQPPHTYRIDAFKDFVGETLGLPVTRTLYLTEDRNIDPPSPRLLAIHSAIGHILHLSGAGDYIDRVFRDAEEYGVRSDGSTQLGILLSSKLNSVACIGVRS